MADEKSKSDVMHDDIKLEKQKDKEENSVSATTTTTMKNNKKEKSIETCGNKETCITLRTVVHAFNSAISEEQAWAVLYQLIKIYKERITSQKAGGSRFKDVYVPTELNNVNIHKDGSVHINMVNIDENKCRATSQRKILVKLGVVIYAALDFNLSEDEEPLISEDLAQVINLMTAEDNDDEGIERDSEDLDEEKYNECETKELDNILQLCTSRLAPVSPNSHQNRSPPDDHYRAVCRALAAESFELRVFLEKVSKRDIETFQLKGEVTTSTKELEKLSFNEWARFWMQVVDELRRGFQLKKISFTRTPIEYELTPYEMLMEDIRSRRYKLRKVMINGDIPPRVKKDAQLVILEFIRSRPPLKKASDRKLPPPRRNLEPREKLLDQIRQGRVLKPVVTKLKSRLLASNNQLDDVKKAIDESNDQQQQSARSKSPRNTLRLIPVDLSLLQEDDFGAETTEDTSSQEPYSICFSKEEKVLNQENNQNNLNTVVRRQAVDRQASALRRHTIVGCHKSFNLSAPFTSMPAHSSSTTSTADEDSSLRSSITTTTTTEEEASSSAASGPSSLNIDIDEPVEATPDWRNSLNLNDKLSLTLEEIIHIRSVMTKAELESLPVGVKVKEEVERRKLCFLCLRTRFSLFGQRGVNCKLCDRTVCIKCFSKMRIPRDQFRNVPVVLLSPSLLSTPAVSNVPSPIHHHHVNMEESFSRNLMERLLRPDVERKSRSSVGSAPSSPKNQRSLSGTPQLEQEVAKVNVNNNSIMSRSMEGPRNVLQSPGRPHSNNSTLDRRHRFFALSSQNLDPKETLRGEIMAVCNDCKALVLEIMKSSRQTRSSARNIAIKNLTLDLSPVYKRS